MPSQRRMRVVTLLLVVTVIALLYMTGASRQTRSSDFYTKTQEALQAREYETQAKIRDANDVGSRLKEAEDKAKSSANKKESDYMKSVEGHGEKSVAGRVKLNSPEGDKKVPGVASQGGKLRDQAAMRDHETPEDHEMELELNDILKKGPIIIFSKTYCPHSRKAKHILLEKYHIVPTPYVVELDEYPNGDRLQKTLGETTGRRTVPNVLLMGKSIGGGDEMQELDETDKLLDKIKSLGGSRIVEATHKERSEMRRRRSI